MKIEIRCSHPIEKREYYEPGWYCTNCGATGVGDTGHWNPVIGFFELPDSLMESKLWARMRAIANDLPGV